MWGQPSGKVRNKLTARTGAGRPPRAGQKDINPHSVQPGTEEGCRRCCDFPGVLKDQQLSLNPGKWLT